MRVKDVLKSLKKYDENTIIQMKIENHYYYLLDKISCHKIFRRRPESLSQSDNEIIMLSSKDKLLCMPIHRRNKIKKKVKIKWDK